MTENSNAKQKSDGKHEENLIKKLAVGKVRIIYFKIGGRR